MFHLEFYIAIEIVFLLEISIFKEMSTKNESKNGLR
jgi:hypothetical protein